MKIRDILTEDADQYVKQFQQKKMHRELKQLERKLSHELSGVAVQFTGHFSDRMLDDRNDPMITIGELEKFIDSLAKNKYAKQQMNSQGLAGLQTVVTQMRSKLNVPFVIKVHKGVDKNGDGVDDITLTAKTIMRKEKFSTPTPRINIERKLMNKNMLGESGSMEGVGPIAREEILPTLKAIEKDLGISLSDVTLGSAGINKAGTLGKKQFSGDIDAAVNVADGDKESFEQKLKDSSLIIDYKLGNTISTKVKIVDYDADRMTTDGEQPEGRTGFVQLDFMPGNPAAKRAFYWSPEEGTSQFKGAYRTELLMIVAAMYDQKNSAETLPDGRPLESERWLFSPTHALVRVLRTPKMGKKGYTKANDQKVIGKPITDLDEIARTLGLGSGDDLDSFESLWAAVKQHRSPEEAEAIKQAALKNHIIKNGGEEVLQ